MQHGLVPDDVGSCCGRHKDEHDKATIKIEVQLIMPNDTIPDSIYQRIKPGF